MRLFLLSYADDRFGHKGGVFRHNQLALNRSAAGRVDEVVSWRWEDLAATEFYRANATLLDKDRFCTGAAWKPFIVAELLERVSDGDVILYHDCGPYLLRRSLDPLASLCKSNGGTLFHQWGDRNASWTKRDAFVLMGADEPRFHDAVHLQNTWFLVERTDFTRRFVAEWLAYNIDERIASYVMPNTAGLPNLSGFVEHRGDQSIFSILAARYGVRTFVGAGGPANRDINRFIDTLTVTGRARHAMIAALRSAKRRLAGR